MFGLIIFIHVVVCILLIGLILIQRGRGGGLVESFSDFESMFGPKTSTFMNRLTTVLAILFLFTCLCLAFISARQSRSLLSDIKTPQKLAPNIPLQPSNQPLTEAKP
jgi:preprotein translocase subunit SecG